MKDAEFVQIALPMRDSVWKEDLFLIERRKDYFYVENYKVGNLAETLKYFKRAN